MWCYLMRSHPVTAKTKPITTTSATRASVTFPPEVYSMLEVVARGKKVSVPWVVRDSVEKYLDEEQKCSLEGRST